MKNINRKSQILAMVALVLIGLLISFSQTLNAASSPGADNGEKRTGLGAVTRSEPLLHPEEMSAGLFTALKTFILHVRPDDVRQIQIAADGGPRLEDCVAYLASRVDGQNEWDEERANYKVEQQTGDLLVLRAVFKRATATVRFERTAPARFRVSGRLVNTSPKAIELARFHYLDGLISDRSLNLLSMRQYELPGRIVRPDEALLSPKAACEKGWGSVVWPRLAEPVHAQANTAISGDSGLLAPNWNAPGFFFGFTGPGTAFGEIGIRTGRPVTPFYLAVLLDAVLLKPHEQRILEEAIISFGDPQNELRHWIQECARTLGPPRLRPPLVGYCSWYQLGQRVKPADIRRAMAEFASWPTPPGGKTIQIDDGYQVCPGDWTGRGEWKEELPKLSAEIRAKGFIPGIWVAPTAIQASHPIAKEHPDWLQHDASGQPCIRFHNWRNFVPPGSADKDTYFLDPDHPEARKFIKETLRALYDQGWRYFKIDFAYTVSDNRVKVDRTKTTYETLRSQWQLFREALGEDALINSCNGGIWRYAIGVVDLSRLGGDIGSKPATLRRNIAEMMLRTHVNGVWFQADPDVYAMRTERSGLSFEQSHLLTATQGLIGSTFLTSDLAQQWDDRAAGVVRRYWNAQGPRAPAAMHVYLDSAGLPETLAIAYGEGQYALGLYNWKEAAADVRVNLREVRIPAGVNYGARLDSYGGERIALDNGVLTVFGQPGASLRIVRFAATER